MHTTEARRAEQEAAELEWERKFGGRSSLALDSSSESTLRRSLTSVPAKVSSVDRHHGLNYGKHLLNADAGGE